jgi:hypothetical protein
MKPIPVFVGYDPREAVAYHTCVNSIIRNSSRPVAIVPVALNLFRDYAETHTDGSNHFIYTRFLVPYLCNFTGHAIFIDGEVTWDYEKYTILAKHIKAVARYNRIPIKWGGDWKTFKDAVHFELHRGYYK